MSNGPFPSPEQRALEVLREAEKPLTTGEILERLPRDLETAGATPREWLRSRVLQRAEVGTVGRGLYVYLPTRISGSTLRIPLTGQEAEDGFLRLGPEIVYNLWFGTVGYYSIRTDAAATCELPNGERVTLIPGEGRCPPAHAHGDALQEWLRQERTEAGDSLLLQIQDAQDHTCRVRLERLANREMPRIAERNRELADLVEQLLLEARRPLRSHTLVGHLMARDFYRDACPPDPFYAVLFRFDNRFAPDGFDEVALSTPWDRRMGVVRGIAFPPYGLDPWLNAVGSAQQQRGTTDDARETVDPASQVYRLRVRRGSQTRTIEVCGDQTLGDLDVAIRIAFDHDTWDHLSEFYLPAGSRRGGGDLGAIEPGGEGEGAEHQVGELGLAVGDTLKYVYDFGDWLEHTVTVEAIVPVEPGAEYPREVKSRTGRRRT